MEVVSAVMALSAAECRGQQSDEEHNPKPIPNYRPAQRWGTDCPLALWRLLGYLPRYKGARPSQNKTFTTTRTRRNSPCSSGLHGFLHASFCIMSWSMPVMAVATNAPAVKCLMK